MGATMSGNWIKLVPVDPRYIPDRARQVRAMIRFAEIAPNAEIDAEHCETVKFFDCGANFKQVRCPACGEQVAVEWWQDRMDKDSGEGFQLAAYELPCCKTKCTLNDLVYDWPQAFGKFVLGAINSNIKTLKDEHKSELEDILATKLRVVYQHL